VSVRDVKYLPLLWSGLWRKPVRTVLTTLSIAVAFVLFGVLHGVVAGFERAVETMSDARLRVMSRANILEGLPIAYGARIAAVPGVRAVSHATILVSYYREPSNGVTAAALDMDTAAIVFSEMKVPPEQFEAARRLRTGALVGAELARRYGWRVGDRITLHALNWVQENGSPEWTFDIVGEINIGDDERKAFSNELYFNYAYLEEARATGKGTVHQYAVAIDDPARASDIAVAIDRLFANSSSETTTMNEKEYVRAQLRQIGDVQFFVNAIIGAVLFTLLFLAGNTMSQSVRDRVPELGVLKTVGFGNGAVVALVVAEALTLCAVAAALGLGVASLAIPQVFGALGFGSMPLGGVVLAQGLGIAVLLALSSAALPAWRAVRLTIADALAGR
jgi:putative ABC transport system permease protein